MIIWTAKLDRKKWIAAAAVICACAAAAALLSQRSAVAAMGGAKTVKDEASRVEYLQSWGWEVSPEAVLVEELQIPQELGPDYDKYLALQSEQGFDLAKYRGKRIRRYTYDVYNYPSGESGVIAHLLTCKNTVIGGEIMGGGFLHGLGMPEGGEGAVKSE